MKRPVLSLWGYLWRVLFPIPLLLLAFLFGGVVPEPLSDRLGVLILPTVALLAYTRLICWHYRWLWRLILRIRTFRTWAGSGIVLHYARELDGHWDFAVLQERVETERAELAGRFGFKLRGPVRVFLFPRWTQIGAVFGDEYAAAALPRANAIAIAEDFCTQEIIRHELVHLYSARWNLWAPPLLNEGFATWLQGTCQGRPIDAYATLLVRDRRLCLAFLLRRRFFYAQPRRAASYMLAGSFTGYLIRRFGWDKYRKLFRTAGTMRFSAALRKCLGIDLESAESQWRDHLLAMEVLNRRMRSGLFS